jgi:CHAT domain-containing protein
MLQVYEIVRLRLNVDLVVLSACETSLGKHVQGEGLVGLTQAFLYAGAATVVATLWNVADRSSAELMVLFHRALDSASRAEALRRAQLDLIRRQTFSHPYFWAGFSVIGASR